MYETDCTDYEFNGDTMADHYDYEDNVIFDRIDDSEGNAIFDRLDGFDFVSDNEPCPVCAVEGNCVGCKAAAAELADEEKADCDDVPI